MTGPDTVLELLDEWNQIERLAGIRAWEALMLSPTPEVWYQLLQGEEVPVDQLDPDFLRRARSRRA